MSKTTKIIAALGVVAGLGVAALPLASYAEDVKTVSGEVELTVTVGNAIAMSIQGEGEDTPGYAGSDPANASTFNTEDFTLEYKDGPSSSSATMSQNDINETMSSAVKVYTNNESGYELTIKAKDGLTSLTSGVNSIPAGTNIAAGTAAWGYKVNDGGYTAITGDAASIHTSDEATMNGELTTVDYGVSTAADQAAGVYTGTIVFTATTK